ncbi:MAG: glycogen phosphorylase [Spirochaetes bacterium GWD1_61_31]|nr:MAG: glycogen phosphorylase [Spirochaetes bacterium GWB1_60_80]OHD34724.1 MAG: glycogen phosphorylase [Spirochaetes bacterium GWC1_61_12]OHD38742.1 MAG: glycogen phosphorylase [Spirochaetes bacterium GWD1_61_31]OHD44487.1 MAG: glycogen phosphorylase [Spirochaetes bacterium GWE1_60_18]OHD59363.1 MAG: glycogen phosphorylase [Spirochaetes bacterium GWF1_60_12]HAP43137.1 glycogen phosphorylase [Spirochaetaceae bacterium]
MSKANEVLSAAANCRWGKASADIAWGYAKHLKYTLGVDRYSTSAHDRYLALAYAVRDRLIDQWIATQQVHHDEDVKRVYYLSLEFLMGRALGNNVINMRIEDATSQALQDLGYDWEDLREQEMDAGLGNGGLGRLAACFLDSMASLDLPAFGYGLRYDYGIFKQRIENGYQLEQPDEWLRFGNPWELERPDITVPVQFGGWVETHVDEGRTRMKWHGAETVLGVAYDTPVVGYGGHTVNTLRLWSAKATEEFDFDEFNEGDYVDSVKTKVMAENLTKILYPNDKLYMGKELRLKQQYLFVACSLWDIIRRFKKSKKDWSELPNLAAIQLNDTHPSLAVPELMRILVDNEGVEWDKAWEITVKTLAYTNHTLMPEALEKWPVPMLEKILPRHLQIIYAINHKFLQQVAFKYPGDMERMKRMSIMEEGEVKHIRMANLSIVGSHSTNGVAALHTELLKSRLVPDLAAMYPERFNNKTNGITQRRWLLKANPPLARLITEAIGDRWICDLDELTKLRLLAEDAVFRQKLAEVKRLGKLKLAEQVQRETGWLLNPDSLFDVQVKRIHEYKRQLLNVLHVVLLYNRMRAGQVADFVPRTFIFGGKAAPGYLTAKLIIKLINNIASVVNNDPQLEDRLKVYFLPNYRVSLAERIFPAADLSEQISTAGTEASGTGNMKFMCNGALTIGTLDGANIEIAEEAGHENVFIFGLKADEVAQLRMTYDPREMYAANPEVKAAIDLIFSGYFNISEENIFEPLRQNLLHNGDHYMHIADLPDYARAQQAVADTYRRPAEWYKKVTLNIAASGKFSSDRTIRQYAQEIWGVKPCPISLEHDPLLTLDEARRMR